MEHIYQRQKLQKNLYPDLTGQKFGRWTVESQYEEVTTSNGRVQPRVKCHCKCECGRERDVFYHNLTSGKSNGCGYCYTNGYRDDLTGKTFGTLTVLGFNKETKRWKCRCTCGAEVERTNSAFKNTEIFCNDLSKHPEKVKPVKALDDFTNQRFGKLYVLNRAEDKISPTNGHRYAMWHCLCDCGKTRDVDGWLLKNGKIHCCKDCENINREEKKRLTQIRNERLKAERDTKKKYWDNIKSYIENKSLTVEAIEKNDTLMQKMKDERKMYLLTLAKSIQKEQKTSSVSNTEAIML